MSPIGRVFIILNLLLAGGFVVVSGTHLQTKNNYKLQLADANKKSADEIAKLNAEKDKLAAERNTFENAKSASEERANQMLNANQLLTDENKRYAQQLSSMEGDVKKLLAAADSANTEMKSAFGQAKAAYAMAVADQKAKDDAVRAKDAAEAENRDLKTEVASLKSTIETRDGSIKSLESERSQLGLLVKVAEANGFLRTMAAPNLSGLVTTSSGNLVTIQITDNPGNVDIKSEIERGKWGFAIYDASGYKGEAYPERYEASANAVLCKVGLLKGGAFREGDKAATKTP
ncbi:MAG: hypothetical protein FJ301_12530 [Planctomycetes bacterium]|nr:hypothetical protein [Planctomycetota bacterium]